MQQFKIRTTLATSFYRSVEIGVCIALIGLLAGLVTYQQQPRSLQSKQKEIEDLVISHAKRSMAREKAR